ncbi:unnamed protein product [Peniophora sp. CBMAI 1063]|nr:unnamed protein product [Peniophora sp. CBMAI 1063]
MFKRVKSVFKKGDKEPKEPKEPKPKRKGLLRRRTRQRADSEMLPPPHDSQYIAGDYDHDEHIMHSRSGSIHTDDHSMLGPAGTARSAAPTMMVPPPGSSYARSHHTMSQYPGQYPAHELLNPAAAPLHPFPTTGPSLHSNLMGYPDQHGYVPASMHEGHHVTTHVPTEHDDEPPLPVRIREAGSIAPSHNGGPVPAVDAPPPPPPVAHSRSRNISNESGPPPAPPQVTRSATLGRSNGYGTTHSRAGRRRENLQQDAGDDGVYGEYDAARTLRRIKNLSGLEHPNFGWSKCTGNKKAVCVGINYVGSSHALDGCVEDAKRMYRLLVDKFKFPRENVMVLTDEAEDERNLPTKQNIQRAMQWLSYDAQPHDSLFFHYSGHGGQIRDTNGDEVDGMDEMIFPVDYEDQGVLIDDTIHDLLVKPLPSACRLTALFDSCHSGSIMDLVYLYHSDGRIMGTDVTPKFKASKMTPAEVICWSGSTDSGAAADADINGLQVGAMSYAFVKAIRNNPGISFAGLLTELRRNTRKFHQRPQLSASHRINVSRRFIM